MFEEVGHTADVALRVIAPDLNALFETAARGMFHLMGTDSGTPMRIARRVELRSGDIESLLVDWLNELLFLQESHNEQYVRFDVEELSETRLVAVARGGPARTLPGRKIKAATFHDLNVTPTPDAHTATVVFDV
jgi:SHS2 domain-containing protein